EALIRFAQAGGFEVALDEEGPPPDDPLLRLYGGPLRVRLGTPRLVTNFVATADGVTAFGEGSGEGAMAVSLQSPADRFLMALLRCAADCVLIGAGTLRDDPHHQWTPSAPMPDLGEALPPPPRRPPGPAAPPPLAVVSGSGALPAAHPALRQPEGDVLVITTEEGAARLPVMHPRVRVAVAGKAGDIPAGAVVEAVRTHLAAITILCEGGPLLFGQLLAAGRGGGRPEGECDPPGPACCATSASGLAENAATTGRVSAAIAAIGTATGTGVRAAAGGVWTGSGGRAIASAGPGRDVEGGP